MSNAIDWNQPIDLLPDEVSYDDLPPLARELVRRNVLLRQKLQETEAALHTAQAQLKALAAPKTDA